MLCPKVRESMMQSQQKTCREEILSAGNPEKYTLLLTNLTTSQVQEILTFIHFLGIYGIGIPQTSYLSSASKTVEVSASINLPSACSLETLQNCLQDAFHQKRLVLASSLDFFLSTANRVVEESQFHHSQIKS